MIIPDVGLSFSVATKQTNKYTPIIFLEVMYQNLQGDRAIIL